MLALEKCTASLFAISPDVPLKASTVKLPVKTLDHNCDFVSWFFFYFAMDARRNLVVYVDTIVLFSRGVSHSVICVFYWRLKGKTASE